MARLRWSPQAVKDLELICEYIAYDSEHYARLFARSALSLVEEIQTFPSSGRIVPEYQRSDLRERIFQNYRLVYQVSRKEIGIVAIVHGARSFKVSLRDRI